MPIWFWVLVIALVACVAWMCWYAIPRIHFKCGKCRGTGIVYERGERIPRSELSPMQAAEEMVNGGFTYKRIPVPCKCQQDVA